MKILFVVLSLYLSSFFSPQAGLDMTPYDFSDKEIKKYCSMGIPKNLFCRIAACPEKYRANNIHILGFTQQKKDHLIAHISGRIVKKIKQDYNLIGVIDEDQLFVYHRKDGLVKTVNGIKME